jgi:hypothetical protein
VRFPTLESSRKSRTSRHLPTGGNTGGLSVRLFRDVYIAVNRAPQLRVAVFADKRRPAISRRGSSRIRAIDRAATRNRHYLSAPPAPPPYSPSRRRLKLQTTSAPHPSHPLAHQPCPPTRRSAAPRRETRAAMRRLRCMTNPKTIPPNLN